MKRAIAYDITRLVTRMFNVTPNGIDRVDFAFARHFLSGGESDEGQLSGPLGMIATLWGPRLFAAEASRAAIEGIFTHWGEDQVPQGDAAFLRVCSYLKGETLLNPTLQPRVKQGRSGQYTGLLRWLKQFGAPIGLSPVKTLKAGVTYINVSQFPLWIASYFEWLETRPDIKCVFFVHDLLPIEMPEYFPKAEFERHGRRLANVARYATGVIVASESVEEALKSHLRRLGRIGLPVCLVPLPVAPVFSVPRAEESPLGQTPYFITCGTIEPRKNHLMLLQVWRQLVLKQGPSAPKLIVVGNRGWKYDLVVDLLENSPLLNQHVIEVNGLTTPGLKSLFDGARALLMPSFAEGYGLPVREALMAGLRVIAADIPAFRGLQDPGLSLLSPLNGDAWLEKIVALAASDLPLPAFSHTGELNWEDYFRTIDEFVENL